MKPIETIVAAVDLSDTTDAALEAGRELSKQLGARLHVVHVVHDLSKYMGFYVGGHGSITELQHSMEEEAKTKLEQACQSSFGSGDAVDHAVIRGTPFADLVLYAVEHHAGLLIVGAHGAPEPRHKVFGSVAERLVKNAPCPVLVVGQKG